jgi:hypothetical protein
VRKLAAACPDGSLARHLANEAFRGSTTSASSPEPPCVRKSRSGPSGKPGRSGASGRSARSGKCGSAYRKQRCFKKGSAEFLRNKFGNRPAEAKRRQQQTYRRRRASSACAGEKFWYLLARARAPPLTPPVLGPEVFSALVTSARNAQPSFHGSPCSFEAHAGRVLCVRAFSRGSHSVLMNGAPFIFKVPLGRHPRNPGRIGR